MPQTIPPPQTPQSQAASLPAQTTLAYTTPAPLKSTPTKSTPKALPTVRDHTTDRLNPAGDEYLPREIDEFGEKKVMPDGTLLGNRQYRCRTFLVPNRGDKLFMLATECARVLGYRDSYLLFNKNRSLYKIIASQAEKDDLIHQEILSLSKRSRQIAIVTARSMFRQFGSRVIENGRRVRDDYWETKARKQGFTEADPAGEKRPGAAKAREAAEAQNNALMSGSHTEIVYSNNPGPYPQPHLVQAGMIGGTSGNATRMPGLIVGAADLSDNGSRDYGGIVKGGPRQEITDPAYYDQTRPSPLVELDSQATHAAEFNRSVIQQRDMRGDYLHRIWLRPHEQPTSSNLSQPVGSSESTLPTTRASNSPQTAATSVSQPAVVASSSPQMLMTAPPYSQSISTGNNLDQSPMRGMNQSPAQRNSIPSPLPGSTGSMNQGTPGYNYPSNQTMWSQNPQILQQHPNYGSYVTHSQPPQPQPSTGQRQFPGMAGMQYGTGQNIYHASKRPWWSSSIPTVVGTTPPQNWWAPQ
jgi:hypothetical protein